MLKADAQGQQRAILLRFDLGCNVGVHMDVGQGWFLHTRHPVPGVLVGQQRLLTGRRPHGERWCLDSHYPTVDDPLFRPVSGFLGLGYRNGQKCKCFSPYTLLTTGFP